MAKFNPTTRWLLDNGFVENGSPDLFIRDLNFLKGWLTYDLKNMAWRLSIFGQSMEVLPEFSMPIELMLTREQEYNYNRKKSEVGSKDA